MTHDIIHCVLLWCGCMVVHGRLHVNLYAIVVNAFALLLPVVVWDMSSFLHVLFALLLFTPFPTSFWLSTIGLNYHNWCPISACIAALCHFSVRSIAFGFVVLLLIRLHSMRTHPFNVRSYVDLIRSWDSWVLNLELVCCILRPVALSKTLVSLSHSVNQ